MTELVFQLSLLYLAFVLCVFVTLCVHDIVKVWLEQRGEQRS